MWQQVWQQVWLQAWLQELPPASELEALQSSRQEWLRASLRVWLRASLRALQLGWLQAVVLRLAQTGRSLTVCQHRWWAVWKRAWGWACSTAQCPSLSLRLHTALGSWALETVLL